MGHTSARDRVPGVHGRFVAREVGPAIIGVLVLAQAVLWIVARPAGEPTPRYVGQLLGAESILLLSIGLVLISTLPWVEEWFDGIDQAAIWHRRVAITGLVLLAPHVLLSSNPDGTALGGPLGAIGAIGLVALALWAILPRWQSVVPAPLRGLVLAARDAPVVRDVRRIFGGYERWRALHRTTGLFVAAGFAHGVLDGDAVRRLAGSALELRRRRRRRARVLRLPRAPGALLPLAARLPGGRGPARSTRAWSRSRCARSAGPSTSCPASSR